MRTPVLCTSYESKPIKYQVIIEMIISLVNELGRYDKIIIYMKNIMK